VSLDQTLVSLYRGNPKAFIGENMNRLKAGVVLKVPTAEAAATVDAAEARQLILAQSADFGSFRQRLAGAVQPAAAEAPTRKDAGKVRAEVDDRKDTAPVTADKLTLSKAASAAKSGASEVKLSKEKEKQEVMDIMLNTKKPDNIDFSDNKLNDNKLASDEMERLIAHALSSRQQELEHLTMNTTIDKSKNAEEWISGSNDPVANALNASIAIKRSQDIKRPREQNQSVVSTPIHTSVSPVSTHKKNVSFNERDNSEFVYNTDSQDGDNSGNSGSCNSSGVIKMIQ
jgi:FimV-like protein